MINFYGLAYRIPEYVKKSVQGLLDNASEPFSFTLLVNPCGDKRDDEIIEYGRQLVDQGSIKRMVVFSKNIVGRAYKVGFEQFPDESEKFFVVHDLSKTIPNCDWIGDIREGLKENCLYGFDLDISNRAPWSFYSTDHPDIGLWMMSINKDIYRANYKQDFFMDSTICGVFKDKGWPVKKSKHKVYHQVWNVKDIDPNYWDMKAKGRCNWKCADKANITIYEKDKTIETRTGC